MFIYQTKMTDIYLFVYLFQQHINPSWMILCQGVSKSHLHLFKFVKLEFFSFFIAIKGYSTFSYMLPDASIVMLR